MQGNDTDPHGLFEYRGTLPKNFNPELIQAGVDEILDHFKMGGLFVEGDGSDLPNSGLSG
ncbi:MAG: hypothetical protein ACXADB_06000 [Candidatus Hermodarchaeia archaeon]|jgi:hypothetical protein